MRGDLWVDEILADASERRQGAFLVDPHEPGITDNIGAQDDGKSVLYPGTAHPTVIPAAALQGSILTVRGRSRLKKSLARSVLPGTGA
jgi:hypothetical protein